jgi:hypothetical protein
MLLTFTFSLRHAAAKQLAENDLTVHEWGTFTSIADIDGSAMVWLPLTGSTDLPSFVEHFKSTQFKGGLCGTVRMETPVLYFYSPRETNVFVNVSFSKGLITEWYPHADSTNPDFNPRVYSLYAQKSPGAISWSSVHIDPHAAADFPSDNSDNHYYAARETSSSPLELSTSNGLQREKFLFYRGVSTLQPPLRAEVSPDGTVLIREGRTQEDSAEEDTARESTASVVPSATSTSGGLAPEAHSAKGRNHLEEIPEVILFERRGAQLGYRILGPLRDQASLAPPPLDGSLDSLFSHLEGMLISQGLFPDEAHAMVETWKNSWFEEGSRLIYMVPRSYVDFVLPLSVKPTPVNTVRVFVGRLELITPSTEKAVALAFSKNDRATLAKYARFLEPILSTMMEQTTDESSQQRLLQDLNLVSAKRFFEAPN